MSTKSERINLRCSAEALDKIRRAAELQDQDLTSFILGAALDRARAVLAEERVLRLDPVDLQHLERVLDAEPTVIPSLARLFAQVSESTSANQPASEDTHA